MVRTKADGGGRKAVAAKAPRKALAPTGGAGPSMGSPAGKNEKYAGGNPVCPRPTPEWQKGIGAFMNKKPKLNEEEFSISKENKENQDSGEGCSSKSTPPAAEGTSKDSDDDE